MGGTVALKKKFGSEVVLSVIIVTYKSYKEIADCLKSLPRTLQGRPTELIVVDNASNDGVSDLISKEFAWVKYIALDANLGFGSANNIGYEQTSGEFVLFLNPDTILNETALIHCLRRLQNEPDIGIISPKLVMLNGEMDLACRRSIPTVWDGFCRAFGLSAAFPQVAFFSGYNLTYLPTNATYEVGSVNGAFMMCPRRALLRVGVFDGVFFMYGDDLDLNYRFQKAGYRVVYDGRVEIVHIKGSSSSKEPEKMARAVFSATRQFYLKHFNPHRSAVVELKYLALFSAWEKLANLKAKIKGYRGVRPL